MIRVNNPRVSMFNGRVRSKRTGRTKALNSPKIAAANDRPLDAADLQTFQ